MFLFINPKFDPKDPVLRVCRIILWLLLFCVFVMFGVCMYAVLSSVVGFA